MTAYVLTCYGKALQGPDGLDGYDDLQQACKAIKNHIHTCPQGAMPWAKNIQYHLTTQGRWVTAANGGWLNHGIIEWSPPTASQGQA